MRILVLIHEFPPVGGGGGQAAKDICEGLVTSGDEIKVLTARVEGLSKKELTNGIQVYRISSWRKEPFRADLSSMFTYVMTGLWPALHITRKWRPDIIHVHFAVPAGALAYILSLISGIPYILTTHLGDVPGGVPEKTDQWFRWISPFTPPIWGHAAQVIAVSQYTKNLASQRYPIDMQVIHNGVNIQKLDPGEIRVGTPPTIIFAGRFVPQKNPIQLIKTLGRIENLPWKCVMIGDGALREDIEQEIKRHRLEDQFDLTGWISPDEVIDRFGKSDILFMPSLSEGLPVVGVQALAMGLAIIASNVGGWIDIVEGGRNGYLYQSNDTTGMETGLRSLLDDREALLHARKESRKLAHKFDINAIVERYKQIMLEVKN